MTKPKIGISMVRSEKAAYPNDSLKSAYAEAVISAGGLPVLLPNLAASVELLSWCEGLLLTGGGDFDPSLFGQSDQGTDWVGFNAERDQTELLLIGEAKRLSMPIFGICRGIQALAVAFGGDLIQDIASSRPNALKHSADQLREQSQHRVSVMAHTKTAEILGETELWVNSFHHQAVEQPPPDWIVSARASDGLIEAIEKPGDHFLLGVQWHPENLTRDLQAARRLFEAFVGACREWGGTHVGLSN